MKWYNWLILGVLFPFLTDCCPSDAILKSKIVRVTGPGVCTGEQIKAPSGESYLLTAGHCRGLEASDHTFLIKTEQGTEIKRKFIAEDPDSDLLLIEGLPKMEGLPVADYVLIHENIRTITHGGNLDLYETRGTVVETMKIPIPLRSVENEADQKACESMPKQRVVDSFFGQVCLLEVFETITTASVRPGSSGGPIFNSRGELVGVVSALDGYGFGSMVTLSDIHKFLKNY